MIYQSELKAKDTPGLEDYISAVRRRSVLVLLCALLGLALLTLFTLSRTDQFQGEARVLVNPTPIGSVNGQDVRPVLSRELNVVASNAIATQAAEELGLTISPRALLENLEVTFVDDSDTLELAYVSQDAVEAAEIVNAIAVAYVEDRQRQADEQDQSTIDQLTNNIAATEDQIAELESQIADINRERTQAIALAQDITALTDQISSARLEIGSLNTQLRNFTTDLADERLLVSARTATGEVSQFATVPNTPIGLSNNLLRAAGLILGLGLGVALAFVMQRLDRTARESSDVELALGSTVLGSVPPFGFRNFLSKAGVVMTGSSRSHKIQQARESFRRLRSSLQFLSSSREARTFLITSAVPGEGKSTMTTNTAVALAQGGSSVCLVNADMRRPTVEKLLGVATGNGLSTWLEDSSTSDIMVAVPNISGLVLIPSGPLPESPVDLLASGRLPSLFKELSSQFDFVLIDAPPILRTADAAAISPHVDGTIIVVDASQTGTDDLLRVRSEIERSGGTVLGAVLNRDNQDSGLRLRKDRYAYERVSAARASA